MTEEKMDLETLRPIKLTDRQKEIINYENYEQALNTALSDETDFENIALSGPYGAGKSTIMDTYEQEHEEHQFLHISLAKFEGMDNKEHLEAKIMNQLIHQIQPGKIPQTRFKTKEVVSISKVRIYSGIIIVMIFSLIYLCVVPNMQWADDEKITLIQSFWNYKLNVVALGLFVLTLGGIIYKIVNRQFIKPLIKSIHVDKSEIELLPKTDEAQFDRYMDEIIYLFCESHVDVLVLEDMDRLENNGIFNKLREINFLINKRIDSQNVGNRKSKKHIKFVYMIKDDLMKKGEERTKFFDVMIPVVPVMDHSNSYELLTQMPEWKQKWSTILDNEYIRKLCLEIGDYRVLKNIYNEFKIYYKQLKAEEHGLVPIKLFAMIVYKNFYPEDYALLQKGSGYVYERLQRRKEYIQIVRSQIDARIENIRRDKRAMEQEFLDSVDELDALYFTRTPDNMEAIFIIDGVREGDYATRTELIHDLKSEDKNVTRKRYSCSPIAQPYEERKSWFDALENNTSYMKRKKQLEKYKTGGIEDNLKRIKELEHQKISCEKYSMAQSLSAEEPVKEPVKESIEESTEEGAKEKEIENKALIENLLKDGMIEADYAHYMTYFYPYSITEEELVYINHIGNMSVENAQLEIVLVNIEEVLRYITDADYDSPGVLNYSLIAYMLKCAGENKRLDQIISQMRKNNNLELMIDCWMQVSEPTEWLEKVFEIWPDIWEEIIRSNKIDQEQKVSILLDMFGEKGIFEVEDTKNVQEIMTFLTECEDRLYFKIEENNQTLHQLQCMKYKFVQLRNCDIGNRIGEYIYQNDMYELNQDNISALIINKYTDIDVHDVTAQNYSVIMSMPQQPLALYVNENMDEYIEKVYVKKYACLTSNEDEIIQLLNSIIISEKNKKDIVGEIALIISDVDKIEEIEVVQACYNKIKLSLAKKILCTIGSRQRKWTKYSKTI